MRAGAGASLGEAVGAVVASCGRARRRITDSRRGCEDACGEEACRAQREKSRTYGCQPPHLVPRLVSPVLNSLRWAHAKVNRTTMRMHRSTPGAAHIGSDGQRREVGSQPGSDGRVGSLVHRGSAEGRRCGCGPAPPALRGGRGGGCGTHAPSDVQDIHGHDLRLPQSSMKGRRSRPTSVL
jgi:hypothetical protein